MVEIIKSLKIKQKLKKKDKKVVNINRKKYTDKEKIDVIRYKDETYKKILDAYLISNERPCDAIEKLLSKYKRIKSYTYNYVKRSRIRDIKLSRKTIIRIDYDIKIGKTKNRKKRRIEGVLYFNLKRINHSAIRSRLASIIRLSGYVIKSDKELVGIVDNFNYQVYNWDINYKITIYSKRKRRKMKN